MRYTSIVATGSYLPEKILTNDQLSTMVNTTDEWIVARTGIQERHLIDANQQVSDMAYLATLNALKNNHENATINLNDIDMIIVATFTPDAPCPSSACILQQKLGLSAKNIPCFDINAVCSGFMYALATADAYIKTNMADTILVVGADAMSHYIDYKDRNTCVLFGDGAGAVIVQRSATQGIIASKLNADGCGSNALAINGTIKNGRIIGNPYVYMEGKAVFKMAVRNLELIAQELLAQTGYTSNDIDWFIPHQANIRIIEATANSLGIHMNKVVTSVAKHGNTAAASVPLALDSAIRSGKVKRGDLLLLEGVGAGFTWGATLVRY